MGKEFFFSSTSRPDLGPTQPSNQWVRGVERTQRYADHPPPSSAEVKNVLSFTFTPIPPSVLLAWCLSTRKTLPLALDF